MKTGNQRNTSGERRRRMLQVFVLSTLLLVIQQVVPVLVLLLRVPAVEGLLGLGVGLGVGGVCCHKKYRYQYLYTNYCTTGIPTDNLYKNKNHHLNQSDQSDQSDQVGMPVPVSPNSNHELEYEYELEYELESVHHQKQKQSKSIQLRLDPKIDQIRNQSTTTTGTSIFTRKNAIIHALAQTSSIILATIMTTISEEKKSSTKSSSTKSSSTTIIGKPASAWATYIDPKTKINLPSIGEIENAIPSNWQTIDNPFEINNKNTENYDNECITTTTSSSSQFTRLDNSNDFIFYKDPRFVEHVDDNAVSIMTDYITNQVLQQPNMNVLDLCSSWTSHFDIQTTNKLNLKVSGLGMNEQELKSNPVLTDYTVFNLNMKTKQQQQQQNNNNRCSSNVITLPYEDSSFDIVLCQLSIDYLIYPLDVMKEVGRVLKPNGKIIILFSNRLFLQKAVGLWTGVDDIDHTFIVASYIYFSNGGFITNSIQAQDLSLRNKKGMIIGDPMYVVTAQKQKMK